MDSGVDSVLEGVSITDWGRDNFIDRPVIDVVERVIASRQLGPSVSP